MTRNSMQTKKTECPTRVSSLRNYLLNAVFVGSAVLQSSSAKIVLDSTSNISPPFAVTERIAEIGFSQSIEVTQPESEPLYKTRSKYQDIEVYSNPHYGKILILDGVVQLTERDADSYNEMMTHVPMMDHPNPKRVLVIGGGDGYVLNEVLKHKSVVHVDHVDLDEGVIKVCKEHFPWGKAWEDDRVKLHISDGSSFVKNIPDGFYDVVIQDSSDPFTWGEDGSIVELPSSVLYTEDHFEEIHRVLGDGGVFNFQAETFHIPADVKGICHWRSRILNAGFESSRYGSLYISSYPLGQIGFLLNKKNGGESVSSDSVEKRFAEMEEDGHGTTYYWPILQKSCFDQPRWVHKKVYGDRLHTCGGEDIVFEE